MRVSASLVDSTPDDPDRTKTVNDQTSPSCLAASHISFDSAQHCQARQECTGKQLWMMVCTLWMISCNSEMEKVIGCGDRGPAPNEIPFVKMSICVLILRHPYWCCWVLPASSACCFSQNTILDSRPAFSSRASDSLLFAAASAAVDSDMRACMALT